MTTFEDLLRAALTAGASDVHVKAGAPVTFRVRRALQTWEGPAPTDAWMDGVVAQVIPPVLREQFERERELDCALDVPGVGRFRCNLFQERGRLAMALRAVQSAVRDFDELSLPETVRRLAELPRGILVLSGAPGSGKSTTLAAMVQHLNTSVRKHIVTLEDPIEYLFTDQLCVIEQREVGLDTGSFASGLRNVLRQDPDVLVIGEMRDADSVRAALMAANVGHLVITTLHTGDASRAIRRMLEFFPAADRDQARRQLAGSLQAVLCQKLVRSGGGVVPAVEILVNNSTVAKVLEEDRLEKLPAAVELGAADGMQTFEQALHALLTAGRITQNEALRHAPNPEALRMRIQGVVVSEQRRILGVRD